MWTPASIVNAGDWVMADLSAALQLDFVGLNQYDLLTRCNEYAGASGLPITWQSVAWDRGVIFGAGSSLRLVGRATGAVDAETLARNVGSAISSFWTVFGATAVVYTATGGAPPDLPGASLNPWASALSWVSAAAVVIALAVIVVNIRKGLQ